MPHPRAEVFWQIPTAGTDKMTIARQMPGGRGWARLELTEYYAYMYACVGANTNFIERITSSYLTKVARYLLGEGVSSIEDKRSATLTRVAHTSL